MRGICRAVMLLGVFGLACQLPAQDLSEYGAMTANSGVAAKSVQAPSFQTTNAKQSTSPHLVAPAGPPPDVLNRKDFEANAGEKAGKLMLRSVPDGAEIFINDLLVGRTPLLMVIAPGKYKIDMRGPRQESGHGIVGVMPKETQTVVINLNPRYPASVKMR